MSSLRGRLLKATWTAVLVVGALSAVVTFLIARRETEVLLDGQMQRVALLAASAGASSLADGAVVVSPPPGYETEDDLVVVVRDAAGRVLFRSHPLIDLPALKAPGFANALVGGTDYRTYTLPADTRTVVVAQASVVRRESAIGCCRCQLGQRKVVLMGRRSWASLPRRRGVSPNSNKPCGSMRRSETSTSNGAASA